MPLPPMSSSVGPVIAEMEMNAGTDQDATTVWATVVQACSMFYDTPAMLYNPHGSAFGLTVGSRSAKGKEDFWKYHAAVIDVPGSSIISPSGAVLAGPNYEGKALLAVDLDTGEIVRASAVGHYTRAEVLSLTVDTDLRHAVSFVSTDGQDPRHKSDDVLRT